MIQPPQNNYIIYYQIKKLIYMSTYNVIIYYQNPKILIISKENKV